MLFLTFVRCVCRSVFLSSCMYVGLSLVRSSVGSFFRSCCLSFVVSISLPIYMYLPNGLYMSLSICLFVYVSIYLSFFLSICLAISLSKCLSIYLSNYRSSSRIYQIHSYLCPLTHLLIRVLATGPCAHRQDTDNFKFRWGFPKIRGTLFWGPYNKDPTI